MKHNNPMALRLRMIGEQDARDGKSIEAFFDIPKIRHTEGMRGEYEIGYRAAKREIESSGLKKEAEHETGVERPIPGSR